MKNHPWIFLFLASLGIGMVWLILWEAELNVKGSVWFIIGYPVLITIAGYLLQNMTRNFRPALKKMYIPVSWILLLSALPLLTGLIYAQTHDDLLAETLRKSWIIQYLIGVQVLSGLVLFVYIRSQYDEQTRRAEKLNDQISLRNQAELFHLQQKFQPHFLFNMLNSIYTLSLTRVEEAQKMLLNMSDFLRQSFKVEKNALITLDEEWGLLNQYLNLETLRFGHRLQIVAEMEEGSKSVHVPSLILQPLVENSIKHGLYGHDGPVEIRILTKNDSKGVLVQIENPLHSSSDAPGSGFGLASVKRRMELQYGRADLVQVIQNEKTFAVHIIFPR